MLQKINKLPNIYAFLIIAVVGFAVFAASLSNPFLGDDIQQIVNNPVVHSTSHAKLLFEGGTFYNGGGIAPLSGSYYRPLMSLTFSIIYSQTGAHTFYFHLVQLFLHIGSAILLYLIFRYSFKLVISLLLALLFLVHPLDAQAVIALPAMQDALFLFFGLLSFWLLLRFQSLRSLIHVVFSLFLCLLAKEAGMLFVAMLLLYMFWFDKKRFVPFLAILAIPVAFYLTLRLHAVGMPGNPHNAPIDSLSLWGRILTAPSIAVFYLSKFIFPLHLASGYYWTHPLFSARYTLLPLLVVFCVGGLVFYAGRFVKKNASVAEHRTYFFFVIWFAIGLVAYLQLTPLDLTAANTWFYFPMVGLLGMIGTVVASFKLQDRVMLVGAVVVGVLIIALGLRSFLWTNVWKSEYALASNDVPVAKDNFNAYNVLAVHYYNEGDLIRAKTYGAKSVSIYANGVNSNNLGLIQYKLHEYEAAYTSFNNALSHQGLFQIYDNLAVLTAFYGDTAANKQFLEGLVNSRPTDATAWTYLAVLEYQQEGDKAAALSDITRAHSLAPNDAFIAGLYAKISYGVPLRITNE